MVVALFLSLPKNWIKGDQYLLAAFGLLFIPFQRDIVSSKITLFPVSTSNLFSLLFSLFCRNMMDYVLIRAIRYDE